MTPRLAIVIGSLAVALMACSSDGEQGPAGPVGPAGPQGEAGMNGSPDTGADVLQKLLTVDGDTSGLDADQLDGVSSEEFLRTGTRSVVLPAGAAILSNSAVFAGLIVLPDTASPRVSYAFPMPADVIPGTAVSMQVLFQVATGSPCDFHWDTSLQVGSTTDDPAPMVISVDDSSQRLETLDYAIPPTAVEPGVFVSWSAQRDTSDSCAADATMTGALFLYEAM